MATTGKSAQEQKAARQAGQKTYLDKGFVNQRPEAGTTYAQILFNKETHLLNVMAIKPPRKTKKAAK